MNLKEMFPGLVNSIETVITNDLSDSDTTIFVQDETKIPEAPNLLVIGSDFVNAETVKLIEKNNKTLTVERGFQGVAKSWAPNTVIARNFTAYDHDTFKENIEGLNDDKVDKVTDVSAGTYTKVTTNEQGQVVAGTSLVESDIPNHDWNKITTGKPTTLLGYGITNAPTTTEMQTADNLKVNKTGDSMTGRMVIYVSSETDMASAGAGKGQLEIVDSSDSNSFSGIAIHRVGNFAAYLGLDTDNQLKIGGWSMGAVAHSILHTGNTQIEEGVFTPILTCDGGISVVNYSQQRGVYLRLKKMIMINLHFSGALPSDMTGGMRIMGLPFAPDGYWSGSTSYFYGLGAATAANNMQVGISGYPGSGGMWLSSIKTNRGVGWLDASEFALGTRFDIAASAVYHTS